MSGSIRSLAIVTPFYPPSLGGVQRYSQEFARAAIALGLHVKVITTASVRTAQAGTDPDGIEILRIPARYLPVQGSFFPIPTSGGRRMAEFLRCDAILAQTRFFLTTIMAAGVAALGGRRICVVDHGSGPLRSNAAFARASMLYEHTITAALKCFSPRFFAVSGASAEWLAHFRIPDAGIVPNGIAPRAQAPVRGPNASAIPQIFFAGRLIAEKGIRELVGGVERLVNAGRRVQLRIAGEGPLAPMLAERAAASDWLNYLGRLEPAQVANELERASIFVNPSNYPEGLPTILLEAGSAALPVISTPRGGSGELVRDGDTGWLIARGEPELIAAAVDDAIARPNEAVRRGANLFALIQQQYTWPSVVRRFLAYFDDAKGS